MSKNDKESKLLPESIHGLLNNPPLVKGESAVEFNALHVAIAAAIRPQDAIESIFVGDVACLTWEIGRYRRYAATILNNEIAEGLAALLRRHPDFAGQTGDERSQAARRLAQASCSGDADARKVVAKCLADVGLDESSAPALAFSRKINELEAAMRQVAASEARRANMLHEIDQHRHSLGQRLREVVEGDFVEAPRLADLEAPDPDPLPPSTAAKSLSDPA